VTQPVRRVEFDTGARVALLAIDGDEDVAAAIDRLGIARERPAVALVGGAARMIGLSAERTQAAMEHAIAPAVAVARAVVVDGGTASGVMQLMGESRAAADDAFELLGVAAIGTVQLPGEVPLRPEAAQLDSHHSHFLLVPGSNWGDESPWIVRATQAIAGDAAVAAIVAGGGDITARDVELLTRAAVPIVVLGGTGGVADEIAGSRARREASRASVIAWDDDDDLRSALTQMLGAR
jgi:hypothetical protein